MTDPQFYVFLPSNASLNLYNDNTLTSYKVHLPEPVVLEGEYEVGLQSIIWPKTFYNITKGWQRLYYQSPKVDIDVILIKEGYYQSMNDLIAHINIQVRKAVGDNIQLVYNSISEKILVSVKSGHTLSIPKGVLSHILGFGGKEVDINRTQTSPFATDLSGGIRCLYIYCDIAGYQIVGDTKARLLKVVPVEGKYGDTIFKTFDVPTYYPVGIKEFQDIKIDIRDDSGQKVHFNSGRVAVNLHIRQRQLSYIV
jgi:hypothetical protein